jgi:hypothetical protein
MARRNTHSPEVRERAVGMVEKHWEERGSQWLPKSVEGEEFTMADPASLSPDFCEL